MHRAALVFLCTLACASAHAEPDREAAERCARGLQDSADAGDVARVPDVFAAYARNCGALHRPGCREAWRRAAEGPGTDRLHTVATGCAAAYCSHLPEQGFALCGKTAPTLTGEPLRAAWHDLFVAILASDPELRKLADLFFGPPRVIVVELPNPSPKQMTTRRISLTTDGGALVVQAEGRAPVRLRVNAAASDMAAVAQAVLGQNADVQCTITASRDVPHESVVALLDALKTAGCRAFAVEVPNTSEGASPGASRWQE